MAKVTDNEIGRIISEGIAKARAYAGNIVQEDNADALRMFNGEKLGNEQKGRSDIVSNDLADVVNATIAQLQPSYVGDCLAEFEPTGDDDAEQAKAESAAVNSIFVERNQGFYQLETSYMDALLQANGTLSVEVEDTEERTVQRYQGLTGPEKAMLEAQDGWELTEESDDGECVFSIIQPKQRCNIRRIAPENFLVDPNQDGLTYEDSSLVIERKLLTRSQLVEMGINKKVVSELAPHGLDREIDQQARYLDENQDPRDMPSRDRDIIECFEAYVRITKDGKTGVSALEKVLYCDDSSKVLQRRCTQSPCPDNQHLGVL